MMKDKRILVALSSLDGRDAAFERALGLAAASAAELYLLHAVPADQRFSFRAAERLRRATGLRQRAEAAGVRVQTVEQHGDPADTIVLHAETAAVDLIVMGTERRTGWARFREPSVAERVIRRTTRPTLVVRADDTGEGSIFEHVLVAVDLSPASAELIQSALRLSEGRARQVTVVHAVDTLEPRNAFRHRGRWLVPEFRGYVLGEARRQLQAVMPQGAAGGVEPQLRLAAGPAAETIAAQAAEAGADLIVMGRSPRLLHLGSTAVRLLRSADRALLIVPPAASARTNPRERALPKRAA